jgi:hypothetical protein
MKINIKEILLISVFAILPLLSHSQVQQDFVVYFTIEEQYLQEYNAEGMTYVRTINNGEERAGKARGLITYSPVVKMFRVIGPGPDPEYSQINIIKKDAFEKKVLLGNDKLMNPGGVFILIDYAEGSIHINDCKQDKIYISVFDIAKIHSDPF